ncbi:MAG: SDR family oxidoreductase [Burkholderiaceae bacterium]
MQHLTDKRILVTQADAFMGPALCATLADHGAHVISDTRVLTLPHDSQALIDSAGPLDVLVINLAMAAHSTPVADIQDDEWRQVFEVMGSAAALRGMKRTASYSAARGAQLAFVQAAGVELAPDNIQVNAIAQNFVDNPTYFPAEVQANPRFQERLKREVPLGRLVSAQEDTSFVAYLCSDAADCFVGQVFPMSGGWAVR